MFLCRIKLHVPQESPPAWPQEAYRPQHSQSREVGTPVLSGRGGESLLASGLTGATPEKGPGTRGYVPVNRHTHTYENITSSHTSYAGGKYVQNVQKKVTKRSNYTQYVILKVTKTLTLHDEVQTFAFGMKPIQSARIHNNILTFFFFFFFFWLGREGGVMITIYDLKMDLISLEPESDIPSVNELIIISLMMWQTYVVVVTFSLHFSVAGFLPYTLLPSRLPAHLTSPVVSMYQDLRRCLLLEFPFPIIILSVLPTTSMDFL